MGITSPNGQGIAALQILNIMEGYNIAEMGFGSAEYIHIFTEAKKLAFEDRAKFYADMDFYETPIEWLLSDEYADERRKLIDPNKVALSQPAGILKDGDTIYMTVADKDGNMVSLIQSNYRGMGSGMTLLISVLFYKIEVNYSLWKKDMPMYSNLIKDHFIQLFLLSLPRMVNPG